MSSPTYFQSLKAQLEPPMRNKLSKLIENFEEESKKPGSNAQKILASMVAMVASIQIAKRIAEEAALTALNIEKMFEKDTQKHSVHVNHFTFDEEENLQDNVTPVDATARLTSKLDQLYAQQAALEKQYQKSLEELQTLEKDEINQVLLDKTGVAIPPEKTQKIIDFYETRAAEEPERLATLEKAMKPNPESAGQNNEKDELAEERAYRSSLILERMKQARANQSSELGNQLLLVQLITNMYPEDLKKNKVLGAVNAVASTKNNYNRLFELASNDHQQAKLELNEKITIFENSLAKAQSATGRPRPSQTSRAEAQRSENQEPTATPLPTPFNKQPFNNQ